MKNMTCIRMAVIAVGLVGSAAHAQDPCVGANCPRSPEVQQSLDDALAVGTGIIDSMLLSEDARIGDSPGRGDCLATCKTDYELNVNACASSMSSSAYNWVPIECNALTPRPSECRSLQDLCNEIALQQLMKCILPSQSCTPLPRQ